LGTLRIVVFRFAHYFRAGPQRPIEDLVRHREYKLCDRSAQVRAGKFIHFSLVMFFKDQIVVALDH
jgi:hypothetical protein